MYIDLLASLSNAVEGNLAIKRTLVMKKISLTSSFGVGGTDSWLVKTDLNGNAQWNKTNGGLFNDGANCVVEANDGGFAR